MIISVPKLSEEEELEEGNGVDVLVDVGEFEFPGISAVFEAFCQIIADALDYQCYYLNFNVNKHGCVKLTITQFLR